MSRSGLIALIIIAVLTVAGGVYWYVEFMPLADFGSKKSAEAPKNVEDPIPVEVPTSVEAPKERGEGGRRAGLAAPPPPAPVEAVTTEVAPEATEVVTEPIIEPQIVTETVQALPVAKASDDESEVEVTIIPFPELEHILSSSLFALSEPFPVDLSLLKEPKAPSEPEHIEADPIMAEEEQVAVVEAPIELVHSTPIAQSEPAAEALKVEIPTARIEEVAYTPAWLVGTHLSVAHLSLSPTKAPGFDIAFDVMRRYNDLFSWGGMVAVGKSAADWHLDLLASARWTWTVGEKLSIPLTIAAGPSLRFASPVQFGGVARAAAAIRYELFDRFALFYEIGLSARFDSGGFTAIVEPATIGFSYSF